MPIDDIIQISVEGFGSPPGSGQGGGGIITPTEGVIVATPNYAVTKGDVVCVTTGGLVTLATPSALTSAKTWLGVAASDWFAFLPGLVVIVDGQVLPSISGLNSAGTVIVNSSGRAQVVSDPGDSPVLGYSVSDGNMTLARSAGGALPVTAVVQGAIASLDVLVPANQSDATIVTKASLANRATGLMVIGVATEAAVDGAKVTFAGPGSRIATTLGAGKATYVVTDVAGHLLRKDAPGPSDLIVGTCDTLGNLTILPQRSGDGYINPGFAPFSAVADGSVPASDAIQAALDEAVAGGDFASLNGSALTVQVPPGYYDLDKPLHIYTVGQTLQGMGHNATHLAMANVGGPAVHVSPRTESLPYAANDFAGGNALIMSSTIALQDTHFAEVSEYGAGFSWDGLASWGAEFIIQKTSAGTYGFGGTILASSGERLSSDPGDPVGDSVVTGVVCINLTAGTDSPANSVFFQLVTTTGKTFMYAPANCIPVDGLYHLVECNYDGTNMRILVDRMVVATVAKTGTLVQYDWERTQLNRGQCLFYGQSVLTGCPDAKMTSVRISDIARNTTSAGSPSLPTTKFTFSPGDVHTLWSTDFDHLYPASGPRQGTFLKALSRSLKAGTSQIYCYYPTRHDDVGSLIMSDVTIKDMAISSTYGDAVHSADCVSLRIRDVLVPSCKSGFRLTDNNFKSEIHACSISAGTAVENRRIGILLGNASYMTSISNCDITGFDVGTICMADSTIRGPMYYVVNRTSVIAYEAESFCMYGQIQLGDEGGLATGQPVENQIMLIKCANANLIGVEMGTIDFTVIPLIIDQQSVLGGATRVTLDSCFFQTKSSSSSGLVRATGGLSLPLTGNVTLRNPVIGVPSSPMLNPIIDAGTQANFPVVVDYKQERGSVSIALTGSTYTLTRDQQLEKQIVLTGTPGATCLITVPAVNIGERYFDNRTNQTVQVKMTGGTNVVSIPTNTSSLVRWTSTDVVSP